MFVSWTSRGVDSDSKTVRVLDSGIVIMLSHVLVVLNRPAWCNTFVGCQHFNGDDNGDNNLIKFRHASNEVPEMRSCVTGDMIWVFGTMALYSWTLVKKARM